MGFWWLRYHLELHAKNIDSRGQKSVVLVIDNSALWSRTKLNSVPAIKVNMSTNHEYRIDQSTVLHIRAALMMCWTEKGVLFRITTLSVERTDWIYCEEFDVRKTQRVYLPQFVKFSRNSHFIVCVCQLCHCINCLKIQIIISVTVPL